MKKSAEYRRHADECRKLALGASSPVNRDSLLDMAETWAKLAEAREELLARYPELDSALQEPAVELPAHLADVGSAANLARALDPIGES